MTRRLLLVLGTVACTAVAACKDIPVLPQWDADWILPLPSQDISLPGEFFGSTVPANTSFPIDFPVQQQPLSEAFASFQLDETLRPGSMVILTLSKPASTALSIVDTLFVGESNAALNATDTRTIRLVMALGVNSTQSVDTVVVTTANLDMIQDVARSGGSLYVVTRGTAGTGSNPHTFSAADILNIRVQLVARVAINR